MQVILNDLRQGPIEFFKMIYKYNDIVTSVGNAFELVYDRQFDLALATEIIEHVAILISFWSTAPRTYVPAVTY